MESASIPLTLRWLPGAEEDEMLSLGVPLCWYTAFWLQWSLRFCDTFPQFHFQMVHRHIGDAAAVPNPLESF